MPNSPDSTETNPLFDGPNALLGFEFCCQGRGTYEQFGFVDIEGDFAMLNGGHFASGIIGAVGERVFASDGDGFTTPNSNTPRQLGSDATGSMSTPEFIITADYINFLIGGGSGGLDDPHATAVVLRVDGEDVRVTSGNNVKKVLRPISWDVSAFRGRRAQIRFVDRNDGSQGGEAYILADDFRMADTSSAPPQSTKFEQNPAPQTFPLFGVAEQAEAISGFEFCCGVDGFIDAGFLLEEDFMRLNGPLHPDSAINPVAGMVGKGLFASYAGGSVAAQNMQVIGLEAVGQLTSPEFIIRGPYINFLVGGGSGHHESFKPTVVVLEIGDAVIRSSGGSDQVNQLEPVSWDVRGLQGSQAVIKIIDEHDNTGGTGRLPYIMADDFQASSHRPEGVEAQSEIAKPGSRNQPLFAIDLANLQNTNIASFEFCCFPQNAFARHGFAVTGGLAALDGGFSAKDNNIVGAVGSYVFSSAAAGQVGAQSTVLNSKLVGTLTSPEFTIKKSYINFRIGGGSNSYGSDQATAAVLLIGDQVACSASGHDDAKNLRAVSWAVGNDDGKRARIRLIDSHDGSGTGNSLAYLLADDFQASNFSIGTLICGETSSVSNESLFADISPVFGFSGEDISGFEFCCEPGKTIADFGFRIVEAGVDQLDGGVLISDIDISTRASERVSGGIDSRVFSSAGTDLTGAATDAVGLSPTSTGQIDSPEFTIDNNFINFFIGGGGNAHYHGQPTAVALIVDGQIVRASSGNNDNRLRPASWNVSEFNEKAARIRFIDKHDDTGTNGELAYILADDFRISNRAALGTNAQVKLPSKPIVDQALFSSNVPGQQNLNVSGFEFCCKKLNTYFEHGFTTSGDFNQLDGGFWASGIIGAVGERVFSSYGDGSPDDFTEPVQIGPQKTGTLTTPSFTIAADYINFLVGGGSSHYSTNKATAVVLRIGGNIVRATSGGDRDNRIAPASWDVSEFNNRNLQANIEIIDRHDDTGGTGQLAYILADNFRAADRSSVPEPQTQLPPDPQNGKPLFVSYLPGQQNFNVSGFEFCCKGYETYNEHGFVTYGDFNQLDGGFWASGITGAVSERVFSSYGDGARADGDGARPDDAAVRQIGVAATGRMYSPSFFISTDYINFLIGGGSNQYGSDKATAVALMMVSSGDIVRATSGGDRDNRIVPASWDVSDFIGRQAIVKFIDEHDNTGGGGELAYILADEFRAANTMHAPIDSTPPTLSISGIDVLDGRSVGLRLSSDERGLISVIALPTASAPDNLNVSDWPDYEDNLTTAEYTAVDSDLLVDINALQPDTDYTLFAVIFDFDGNPSPVLKTTSTTALATTTP